MTNNGGNKGEAFSSGNKGMVLRIRKAIILYPSLMTPAVVTGSDYIYILLLEEKKKPLSVDDINWQLKIMPGLDAAKNYWEGPLFKKDPEKFIKIIGREDLKDGIYDTGEQFSGIIDKRARKVFKKEGFEKVCSVRIHNGKMKEDGIYNALWVYSADSRYQTMAIDPEFETSGKTRALNHTVMGKCYANELQDFLIQDVVKGMNGPKIKEKGCYAFEVKAKDVDTTKINTLEPLQSYHPIFYYNNISYAGIGHMGDIHLSSRQNLLAKSKARVIDYLEKDDEGIFKERDQDVSREIGSMVNICSRNLKELLDKMGNDPDIQIILMSGDLIDFIRNLYMDDIDDFEKFEPTVKEIWDRVTVKGKFKDRYQKFVDSISIYSLIVDFYRNHNHQKPVFVVSGNHDCYRSHTVLRPALKLWGLRPISGPTREFRPTTTLLYTSQFSLLATVTEI